ncbi:MAG: alanine--tRNA ligase [Lacipirellulaceae bacterium]
MQTNELREKYLAFYETKDHTRVGSDVLVPTWDPSVLFTPAGMNQFKDHFLGKVKLDFTRATTCQKCLRTGDIDNVGRTAYHHTFFEMLGNFSFGDYFKSEAIHWAWEFLTEEKWLGLDPARLSVTVYKDDDEAADIWHEKVGVPTAKIARMEEDENFWPASAPSLGPDGVCGPCSEIYYTDKTGKEVEIWNLVFTQFNRVGDPPDNLRPLPSKNIDTGMGLERTAATLQGVPTNYHIDILMPIVEAAAEVCGVKYELDSDAGRRCRRITDHVRACTFAVHENVYPGANKEKYVVKRLLRRAVLDGHQMGLSEPFLHKLVPAVVEQMKAAYPELTETVDRVSSVIESEEANFFGTIDAGLNRIDRVFEEMKSAGNMMVEGAVAAELYQTYGVPPELFEQIAAEQKLAFDWDGYAKAMEEHGQASGKVQHTVMGAKGPLDSLKQALEATEFLGYESTSVPEVHVLGIIAGEGEDAKLVEEFEANDANIPVQLVLDRTPFYGESGGQVGDSGKILCATDPGFVFKVEDVQKDGSLVIHHGHVLEGRIQTGDSAEATVDEPRRAAIARAHSATHLLHLALQKHLGTHAQQQGSKVDDDWLRFDFTNLSPVSQEQLAGIASDVREHVESAAAVKCETLPLADARQQGAMMLFGEKYPDPVRMVSMGPLAGGAMSRELCGGTHLTNTGEVDAFEILSEEGVSAGTRRIVALTGEKAKDYREQIRLALTAAAEKLRVAPSDVPAAAQALSDRRRQLKKALETGGSVEQAEAPKPAAPGTTGDVSDAEMKQSLTEAARLLSVAPMAVADRIEALQAEVASLDKRLDERASAGPLTADSLLENSETVGDATLVVADVPGIEQNLMRQLIDQIRQKTSPSAVLLASASGEDKVTLIAGISKDLQERGLSAGKWIGPVAKTLGGGGGGRPDMAQAGGKQPEKLPEAMDVARKTIAEMLQ